MDRRKILQQILKK